MLIHLIGRGIRQLSNYNQSNKNIVKNVNKSKVHIENKNYGDGNRVFRENVNNTITGLEGFIEITDSYSDLERAKLKRGFNNLKHYITDEKNIQNIHQLTQQMKGGNLSLGDDKRINILICFLVLLKVNNDNYKIREENTFYKVSSQQNSINKDFLIYDLSMGDNKHPIKTAGPLIIEYLDSLDYQISQDEKIMIFNNKVFTCDKACMSPEKMFEVIIKDYSDVEYQESTFYNVVREEPAISCANCLGILDKYDKATEIIEVIFSDET